MILFKFSIWVLILGINLYLINNSIGMDKLLITVFIIITTITWFITTILQDKPILITNSVTFLEAYINPGILIWITPGTIICGTIVLIHNIKRRRR